MKESVLFALLLSAAYFQKDVAIPLILLWLVYLFRFRKRWRLGILLTLVFASALFQIYRVQNTEFVSYGFDETKVFSVTGRVAEDSVPSQWGRKSCVIKLLECNLKGGDVATAKGRIRISYTGEALYAGDEVRFSGRFSENGFNAKSCRLLKRLHVTAVRARFISFIYERLGGNEAEKELSALLLLGIKSNPESEVSALAVKSGNSHILALSGMHLSLFTWMLSAVLTPLFGKRYAKLISLSFLLLYIMMIGPKPSLLRAFILSFVFFAFPVKKGIDALLICFFIQLFLLPDTVLTLSSFFSYLSLSGIMTLTPILVASIDSFILLPEKPLSAFLATLGALIFTVPVSFHVFGAYQLSSLLTSPVTGVLIYLYMLSAMAGIFTPAMNGAASYIHDVLILVMEKGASFSMFTTLNGYFVLLAAVIIVSVAGLIKQRRVGYPKSHVES